MATLDISACFMAEIEGTDLSVRNLLGRAGVVCVGVPVDLHLSSSTIQLYLIGGKGYAAFLQVTGEWRLGPLTLTNIVLCLSKTDNVAGSFSAAITLCNQVPLLLKATYSRDGGWGFMGETTAVFSIGQVVESFGIASVPQALDGFSIERLKVAYTTKQERFTFDCTGKFAMDETTVAMHLVLIVKKQSQNDAPSTSGWEVSFAGTLLINNLCFTVAFEHANSEKIKSGDTPNILIATYHHKQQEESEQPSLRELVKAISPQAAGYVPENLILDIQEVKFVFHSDKVGKRFIFGLKLSSQINLKGIPVLGDKLPENIQLSLVDFQVLFASTAFAQEQLVAINSLLPKDVLPLPADSLAEGVLVAGWLYVLDKKLPIGSDKPKIHADRMVGVLQNNNESATTSPTSTKWFDVNKTVGPINLSRIGVAFGSGTLSFALDASLTLGPVGVSVMGLRLGSPLSKFEPVFDIEGMALSLKKGGFELGGSFLKVNEQGYTSFYGTLQAQVGTFGFQALGGHTPAHPHPAYPDKTIPACFFIYANIDVPLGGPPYFSVKGFAGGFGLNNRLKLPTIQELPYYILLPGNSPKKESTPVDTIKNVLPKLQQVFIIDPGQYWVAAGIKFSSFEMIEAFALVTVSFGVELQIALLGSCSMSLPKKATTPIAYIEIVIVASYSQSSGLLAVEGSISPASFLLGDFCRLKGDFVFYVWIAPPAIPNGPKAGDFLVSIGGYHPLFKAPAYYPKLARLELNFNLLPLKVIGQGYFALTPGMLMAGIDLRATWALGPIKVWFILKVDFLIAWAPFQYLASAYVCLGCSVDLWLFTLSVSISARLDIWGPPFGGKAYVDLGIVSFDVYFGSDPLTTLPLLAWSEFSGQFLPTPSSVQQSNENGSHPAIWNVSVAAGVLQTDVEGLDWIVDANDFVIQAETCIPANRLYIATPSEHNKELEVGPERYNQPRPPVKEKDMPYLAFAKELELYSRDCVWNPDVNVKPMGKNKIQSHLYLSLLAIDENGRYTEPIVTLTIEPLLRNMAAALWGEYTGKTELGSSSTVFSALAGVRLSPIPRIPSVVNALPLTTLLFQQGNNISFHYEYLLVNKTYTLITQFDDQAQIIEIRKGKELCCKLQNTGYVLSGLTNSWVDNRREGVLKLLSATFDTYKRPVLNRFAISTALTDWPQIVKLGDTFETTQHG